MADILQINKRKILIIGYGSMGKKYEKIIQKDYLIFLREILDLKQQ